MYQTDFFSSPFRGPSHSTEGSVASSSDTSSSQGIYDIPNVPPIPDFEDDYGHIPPPPPPPLPGQDISKLPNHFGWNKHAGRKIMTN